MEECNRFKKHCSCNFRKKVSQKIENGANGGLHSNKMGEKVIKTCESNAVGVVKLLQYAT